MKGETRQSFKPRRVKRGEREMKDSCSSVSRLLEKYFDQEVTDDERLLVEGHLQGRGGSFLPGDGRSNGMFYRNGNVPSALWQEEDSRVVEGLCAPRWPTS